MNFAGVDINNPKQVVGKVTKDAVRNVIFFSIAAVVIIFIMNHWRTVGFILAIILSIPLAIQIAKFIIIDVPLAVFTSVVNLWEAAMGKAKPGTIPNHVLLPLIGNIFMLLEETVGLIIIASFYRAHYHEDLFGILGFFGIM